METGDSRNLSAAIASFSFKFLKQTDTNRNTVSSPLSFEYLLAILVLGSTDPSHAELLTLLELKSDDCIRTGFTELSAKLKSVKGVTLNVANKLYVKKGPFELLPQIKADAINVFGADIESIDFNQRVAAAARINAWVESNTYGRIRDITSPDNFNSDTRLVLTNAIYFKGTWKYQFKPGNIIRIKFHRNNASTKSVPMIYNEANYRYSYSQKLNAQLLEMSYIGDDTSMVVVLPNEIEGLDAVLEKLAGSCDLLTEMSVMYQTKVKVTIPKFKIETTLDLNSILSKLGINAVFQPYNSGLTKILDNDEPLFISQAIQKAFIEVNEEGSEAAAASAVLGGFGSPATRDMVQTFVADRPFLAGILVGRTPYFLATFREPV